MSVRTYQSSDLDACRALWAEMVQRHRDIYDDPSIGGDNPGLEFDDHLAKVGPDHIWVATSGGGGGESGGGESGGGESGGGESGGRSGGRSGGGGGEVVGLVSLIEEEQQAEVEPIVVSSRHRGRGIGRELLQHAVEQAKAAGILCLSVKPVARNEEAIAFFHENGFKAMGHIQLFMWLGESAPGQWKPGPELLGKPFDY